MAAREGGPSRAGDEVTEPETTTPDKSEKPEKSETVTPTEKAEKAATAKRPRRTVPLRVARALVVLAVVTGLIAVGVVVWTFTTRTWEVGGREVAGQQREQQAERDELMTIGQQFMLRSGTYGPEGLDEEGRLAEYRSLVTELITPAFANTFETDAGIADQLVAQSRVSRTAEVFSTGVGEMADDEATVLVSGSITDSYPELEQPQEPFPFRVEVRLVRVDGEWLVDDFAGVQPPEGREQPEIDPDLPIPSDEPAPGGGQGSGQGSGGQGSGGQGGGQQGGGQGGQQGGDR